MDDEFDEYGSYPWDDDLYWLNQREADDYRDELQYLEELDEELPDEEEDPWDGI